MCWEWPHDGRQTRGGRGTGWENQTVLCTVEALNYRCLRQISQPLGHFHVCVGPNASGKTTFLDVAGFLGDLVSEGLDAAIESRTRNFHDLVWGRTGGGFELAVELDIPENRRDRPLDSNLTRIRYEVAVGADDSEVGIQAEKVILKPDPPSETPPQRELFPNDQRKSVETLITPKNRRGVKTVVNKVRGGNDNFYDETDKGWDHAFKLGPRRSALGNLPEDESKFPIATWLKRV